MSTRIQNVHQQEYHGKKFRSTLEAKTAKVLDALSIPYAYEERKIELVEGFRSPFQKDKVRALTYTPDFVIGPIILECKGFETPEWKIKKKLLFKWLLENEPDTIFYQIHNAKKHLIEILDNHWVYLGYCIKVTSKPTKKEPQKVYKFDSIREAIAELDLQNLKMGAVLNSMIGEREYVCGYKWELQKINI